MNNEKNDYRPLISIIVPIYNSEKYLSKCIDTICGQTYTNIEIILVDDGSTDNSLKIAQSYAKEDSRIKIINQKNSGGVIARKNGVFESKGEYILIEDSDDWLEENLVEKCVETVKKNRGVDIVKFGFICEPSKIRKNILVDGQVDKSKLENEDTNQLMKLLLYDMSCNTIWNQMVKKSLFDFEDDIFKHIVHKGEDLQINLQLYERAKKIVLISEYLYHYFDNPNGITNSVSVAKVIGNVRDNIYLNTIRKEIALNLFGHVDEEVLFNKTLSLLSGMIIKLLANSDNPRDDLSKVEKNLKSEVSSYLSEFDVTELNQNILQKKICVNIINGDYMKNLKYRPVCKTLKMLGKVK